MFTISSQSNQYRKTIPRLTIKSGEKIYSIDKDGSPYLEIEISRKTQIYCPLKIRLRKDHLPQFFLFAIAIRKEFPRVLSIEKEVYFYVYNIVPIQSI